jgi:hypothetical protein
VPGYGWEAESPQPAAFLAAQPARSRQTTSQTFLMPSVFALSWPLVDGNLDYTAQDIGPTN